MGHQHNLDHHHEKHHRSDRGRDRYDAHRHHGRTDRSNEEETIRNNRHEHHKKHHKKHHRSDRGSFCSMCGSSSLPVGARFCPYCGINLSLESEDIHRDRGRNDRSDEEIDPKNNRQNDDEKQLAPSVPNKQQVMMVMPDTNDIEQQAIIGDVPAIPTKPSKSSPPPRAPPGGSWGYVIHLGESTCLWSFICCFLCGLIPSIVLCCVPFDKKRAYRSRQGEIYDEHGHLLRNTVKFHEEDPFRLGTDSDQMCKSMGIAICLGVIVVIALVLIINNNSTDDYNDYYY